MTEYCLLNYAVNCLDVSSDKKGYFFFDRNHWIETGEFKAISKVYASLDEFYENTRTEDRIGIYTERSLNKQRS